MDNLPITEFGDFRVIRGDMVKGGVKTPALLRYLPKLNHSHIAYVGSVYGSGAWAVAEACALLNLKCSLFIAKGDYTPPWLPKLKETGAILYWYESLPVEAIHHRITEDYPDLYNLPLGFDTPDFIEDMAAILRDSIPVTPSPPPEIWVPTVSGVLARSACLAFPDTAIHAVCAAKNYGDIGHATVHIAPEKYHKPALKPPPYPACPFSDAKIWQFAEKRAISSQVSGAYILNVSS